ncbi:hypothetical protein CIB95_10800 [Lottiidibacillus patelloidae]|uniref:Uncharacterized protein n=1 Tax=Lottiidibacillus patelloidae TaxID=2670334 RepID=A0A263BT00_9BACI|nr:Ig-like domain-containing protein [Lottiidibacillus patelloidae]OZM56702.1 hypothetical protein CIB95_10800 [Lottiidibacillus patelloidae]
MKRKLALFLTFILLFSQSVFPLNRAFSEYGSNQIFSNVDWLPYAVGEGNDPLDQNPNSTDIAGNSELPAVSYSYDSTYLYFKMRLDANPLNNKNDNFDQYAWTVLFNTDGNEHDWEYMVSLNGLAETVQIGKNTDKELDSWGDQAEDWLWTGPAIDYADALPIDVSLSNFNNDQDFFAYWAVPWTDFAAVTGLTPTSMIQLFYATSANASNYNKDRMGGHPTSFADAWGEPILINGTTPNPPTIEIAGGDTKTTNDNTPLISGSSSAADGSFVDVTLYLKSDPTKTYTYQTTVENGQWQTLVTTALNNGVYNVSAIVEEDGQFGIDEQELTVDPSQIIAPEITITTPSTGSAVTDSTPTISGSYTSGTSTNNIVVEFINGNNVVATGSASLANGVWEFTPNSNLPLGTYQVKATITDEINQTSTSSIELSVAEAKVLNINIDTINPLVTNIVTPVFTGSSNAMDGVTIFVTINNTSYTTTVSNSSWSVQWPEALAEGTYVVSASVEEQGQTASDSINLIVDTTKPTLSINGGTERTTNESTPTISGTTDAPDNSVVTITLNGKSYTTTVTDGTWTVDVGELTDGQYEVTATITDEAGNTTTAKQSLTIDTTGPAIVITSPENGAILNNHTPTVTGTVEAGSTVLVEFIDVNNSVVHSGHATVTNENWTYTPTGNLNEGTYSVKATGTDALGNPKSTSITITIDVTAPTLTINGGTERTTNDSTPTVSGTTDAPNGAIVTVTVNGQSYTATVTDGTWTVTVDELIDGTYEVTATITDEAGNVSTKTQTLILSTIGPELKIDSPEEGALLSNYHPIISGTTNGDKVTITIYDMLEKIIETGVAELDEDGNWTYNTVSSLSDGTYLAKAISTFNNGNDTEASVSFIIDVTAPTLTIDGGTERTTNDSTPTISGTTDAPDNSVVTITLNGKSYTTTVTDGTWTIDTDELTDGTYEVTATITDEAGNSATAKQSLTIDTTGPTIAITSPENGAVLNDQTPTVTGTVEAGSTVIVEFIDENNSVVHSGHATVANENWTYTPTENLLEGTYTVKATGTDALGNPKSTSITITIDVTAPTLTIDGGAERTTNDSTPTVSGTTDAPDNSVVTITLNGKSYTTTVTNGTWTIDVDELTDGTYEVTATITDEAGNSTTATQSLTIDTLAPEVSIDNPLDNSVLELGDIPITGTADVGSKVTLVLDDNEPITLTANENGEWIYHPTPILSEGIHIVTVTAEDDQGNVSEPVSISFKVVDPNVIDETEINITIDLSAQPQNILGNGIDHTILTAKLTDTNGEPLVNYEVKFSAPVGSFPEGFIAFTDQTGIATVKYVSAKTESDETLSYLVSAKAYNLDGNFVEQEQISISFNPAIISGVVIDNETNEPIHNAKVVLSSDFNQDGTIDFTTTVLSDVEGKYVITIPNGNVSYLLEITKPVLIGNTMQDVTFKQSVTAGSVSGSGTDEFYSTESATGIILLSDGSNGTLSLENYDSIIVEVEDESGDITSLNGSVDARTGVFLIDGLDVNKAYTLKFYYVFEDGSKIQVSSLAVVISNDGELNISSCLIDPYGTITNKETGEVIEGAVVELYYADTVRNQENGRVKDTLVELPILTFPPNDNHNPQNSSVEGKYAYMVYPEADYYILVKKNGYELYESPVIEVNQEIVRHDIELTPIPQELPATATSYYNYLVTGVLLLFIGVLTIFLYRRNRYSN